MNLDNIIGNALVKEKLTKSIENNTISNVLLFSGPEGIGKALFATALASKVMHPETDIDPNALKKILSSNHPDLHILKPEGKTALHSIASVRNLITEVFMAPFEAKAKVFVIQDADRMLKPSANALLKTLEEPTLDSYIILISSKPDDILPTILSRCFRMNFNNILDEEIIDYLEKNFSFSNEEARTLSKISNGSIGKAIELASHPDYLKKRDLFVNILAKQNISNYVDLSEALTKLEDVYFDKLSKDENIKIFKEVDLLLEKLQFWFRDLHLLKAKADEKYLYFSDKLDLLKKQDLNNLYPLEKINSYIDEIKFALSRNVKLKNSLENFFLKIDFV